jgi:hypothetical protein
MGDFLRRRRDAFNHFHGGKTCEAGMVSFADERRAPMGHDAVADIFVMIPRLVQISSDMIKRYRFMSLTRRCGVMPSLRLVNPLTQNEQPSSDYG